MAILGLLLLVALLLTVFLLVATADATMPSKLGSQMSPARPVPPRRSPPL